MANLLYILIFFEGASESKTKKKANPPQTYKPWTCHPHPLKQPRRFSLLSEDSPLGFRAGEVYSPFTLGTCRLEVDISGQEVWTSLVQGLNQRLYLCLEASFEMLSTDLTNRRRSGPLE